jgi:hypothetical protein
LFLVLKDTNTKTGLTPFLYFNCPQVGLSYKEEKQSKTKETTLRKGQTEKFCLVLLVQLQPVESETWQ